jgi:mannose-6-phosphate isomerase-like protein (cupin superfamily)
MSVTTRRSRQRVTPGAALALLAEGSPQRWVQIFRHGSLSVEMYKPVVIDEQIPHRQDELYVIVSGHGVFFDGHQRLPFGPGEVLFVPAQREHRFEQFDEDFASWVFLFGPEGGEMPAG